MCARRSKGTPSPRCENQAAVPLLLLSLSKTGQPSFSWGTEDFSWWESSPRWPVLQVLSLNQEKSSGRLGSPLSSIHFASQRLELAQKWLTENSFFVKKNVLLTEGYKRREDNPMTLIFGAGDEKEEVQWVYKQKATSFFIYCMLQMSTTCSNFDWVILGKGAATNSLNIYQSARVEGWWINFTTFCGFSWDGVTFFCHQLV